MRQNRYVWFVPVAIFMVGVASSTLAADIYVTDPAHTLVGFTVRHLMINKVRGKFNEFSGTITYDETNVAHSSMRGTIKTASIDTDNEKRDKDLRSPRFLDSKNFPDITFTSTRVEKRDNGYVLIGDLTIKNVTKQVTIPFAITGKIVDPWGKTRIGFEARLRINRKDFGVVYHEVMDNGGLVVGNTIDIELMGEAVKQAG